MIEAQGSSRNTFCYPAYPLATVYAKSHPVVPFFVARCFNRVAGPRGSGCALAYWRRFFNCTRTDHACRYLSSSLRTSAVAPRYVFQVYTSSRMFREKKKIGQAIAELDEIYSPSRRDQSENKMFRKRGRPVYLFSIDL